MNIDTQFLYGKRLHALDGELGQVSDLFFDDRTWDVRYIVASTGSWFRSHQVLLPPSVFLPQSFQQRGTSVMAHLTREQIRTSPPRETHIPLTREFETAYHSHFGWPLYWDVVSDIGFPIPTTPPQRSEPHLRSTRALQRYTTPFSGRTGFVCGFSIDISSWKLSEWIFKTGVWFAPKLVRIPVASIRNIYDDDAQVVLQPAATFDLPLSTR